MTLGIVTPIKATTDEDVTWLCENIESLMAQSITDWKQVIVNDHSDVEFRDYDRLKQLFKDPRVTGKRASKLGVCNARNLAVETLDTELILPVDADDALPPDGIKLYLAGWEEKGDAGIVYGDTLLVQANSQKVFPGHPYSFQLLLEQLPMPVGALHRKSDWAKIGGWDPRMTGGLEDWEYWIRMGENGVCGYYIARITYHYRRHPRGRLAFLRTNPGHYDKAFAQMRELHKDTFNGRAPVGCCGGTTKAVATQGGHQAPAAQNVAAQMHALDTGDLVPIRYVGRMGGGFYVVGRVSGIRYLVPGQGELLKTPDNRVGVDPQDVRYIINQDGGRSFERV